MTLTKYVIATFTAATLLGSSYLFAGGDELASGVEDETPVSVTAEADISSMIGMSPRDRVAATPKGELKNPYTDNEEMITAGKALYFSMSCNGCHGGGGGGGMCPPLSNEVFVYGSDDDTLFRLVTLGSDDLAKAGYYRTAMEGVVGPMPPFGDLIKKDEDLWKIIAWVRTTYNGSETRRNW